MQMYANCEAMVESGATVSEGQEIARGKGEDGQETLISSRASGVARVERNQIVIRSMDEEARDYVRVGFHLMQQASMRRILAEGSDHYTLAAVWAEHDLVRAALPGLPDRIVRERAVAGMSFIVFEVAERARLIDDGQAEVLLDEEEFIVNLVDSATALLTAPSTLVAPKAFKS